MERTYYKYYPWSKINSNMIEFLHMKTHTHTYLHKKTLSNLLITIQLA
jgi:hypothetical protein